MMSIKQFSLLMSVAILLGVCSYLPAAFSTFDVTEQGKTGLKSMVSKLNTNFGQLKHSEADVNTTVLETTSTNTFGTTFYAAPLVIVTTVDGQPSTNVVTVSSNKFTVTWGATNITYKWFAIDVY